VEASFVSLCPAASQPINEGGQVQGPPRSKGPPSATCKNLCHEIITDTLLTSDTLTISGEFVLRAKMPRNEVTPEPLKHDMEKYEFIVFIIIWE